MNRTSHCLPSPPCTQLSYTQCPMSHMIDGHWNMTDKTNNDKWVLMTANDCLSSLSFALLAPWLLVVRLGGETHRWGGESHRWHSQSHRWGGESHHCTGESHQRASWGVFRRQQALLWRKPWLLSMTHSVRQRARLKFKIFIESHIKYWRFNIYRFTVWIPGLPGALWVARSC